MARVYRVNQRTGFYYNGIHPETGTEWDPDGFNVHGVDKDGYGRDGFKKTGRRAKSADRNREGIDRLGNDPEGFNVYTGVNKDGIFKATGTIYGPDGFDIHGRNADGYDRNNLDIMGVSPEGLGADGKPDPRVVLIRDFIASQETMIKYAKSQGMSEEKFKAFVKEARKILCLKDEIDEALVRNQDRFVATKIGDKDKLLSGELAVKDIYKVGSLLRLCSEGERIVILRKIARAIAGHEITMGEYMRMFDIDGNTITDDIEKNIRVYLRMIGASQDEETKKTRQEVGKELARVSTYKRPYKRGSLKRMGSLDSKGKSIMVDITPELEDEAMEFLKSHHELICDRTVTETLGKMIRGEIVTNAISLARTKQILEARAKEQSGVAQ